MKRIVTIVALMCAVAFQVKAQSSVEQQLKKAEEKAELADKNPTDGKLKDPRHLLFNENDTRILFFNPENYQEILTRFREFKNKK